MKRILAFLAPLALVACGGTGTLNLALTHDSAQSTNTYLVAATATTPPSKLDSVAHVYVKITGIDAHLAGDDAPSTIDPAKDTIKDDDGAWHAVDVTGLADPFDLMSVTATAAPVGGVTLPVGKITQIRLKIDATTVSTEAGYDAIPDAVWVDDAGTTKCALIVPHSAVTPGVKIDGSFNAPKIDADKTVTAEVNLQLNEVQDTVQTAYTCAYRLAPVIKIKKVEVK